jgi:serpin B
MAYEGAAGQTAGEMQKVFNFNPDKAAGRAAFAGLGKELETAAEGAEFKQANSFWVLPGYRFLPEYLKALTDDYKADARQANFTGNPEAARQEINLWTAEQTKDKIKDLFPPNSLTTLTRMVLVNAVYFKGLWEKSFPKERTNEADFTPYSGAPVKAKMMTFPKNADLDYTENEEVQALRLPYKGGTLAMLLVLPRDAAKFAAFEKGLDAAALAGLRAGLGREKVKVFLPRFTFSSMFSLNDALAGLGMPLAFTDAADFSGIDGSKRLYIQKAVQKAFIEVNEEGTEAAAATGVAMGLKSIDMPAAVFRADRPFLFFIEDTKSGAVLFMGRVENPAK